MLVIGTPSNVQYASSLQRSAQQGVNNSWSGDNMWNSQQQQPQQQAQQPSFGQWNGGQWGWLPECIFDSCRAYCLVMGTYSFFRSGYGQGGQQNTWGSWENQAGGMNQWPATAAQWGAGNMQQQNPPQSGDGWGNMPQANNAMWGSWWVVVLWIFVPKLKVSEVGSSLHCGCDTMCFLCDWWVG